jgi:SAM-dependent methyltransferase
MGSTISTGEMYLEAIRARESDRNARRAFLGTVMKVAGPGSHILDFGAGPGMDAKFYAGRGLRVAAYDIEPRMCAAFRRHCAEEIASGQVQLFEGGYREFLERQIPEIRARYAIDVVTANFAPLSLIDDPQELFGKLYELTRPQAVILASVLNPQFVGDWRYGWWWANRLRYWRDGHFSVRGEDFNVYRRSYENFASLAHPYFTLQATIRGLPDNLAPSSSGRLALLTSRYTFLLFARR